MAVDIAQLGFRVESLEAQIADERLKKLTKSANDAQSASARLAKETEKVGRSMQKMGRTMSMYVTAPLLAIGAASVHLGKDFGSTLAKMNTLVGVSRDEIAEFRKEILKIGPSVGRGPTELADALFAITSAGQRGTQAMNTLTNAAKASAIGLGDTRTIALAATAAVQAYGQANVDSQHALEVLIGTIEQGNLEASSLAPVLGRVIGIAAELGVTFEDLGGFIATFTRLGVNADEAATALRSTLATLQKPTTEARDAFKQMNTSIEEVRQKIKEGGIGGFTEVFQDLVKRSREFNVDLVTIVPNVRALSGVLGVFGGEGKVAMEVTKGVAAAVGTMEERFQAVIDLDPDFAFKQMTSEIQTMAVAISDELLPYVLELVADIKTWVQGFRELEPETRKFIVWTGAAVAGLGPIILMLGTLIRLLGSFGLALARAIPYMLTLFGPAGLVIAGGVALGLLAMAMSNTKRETTELDAEVQALIDSMEQLGQSQIDVVMDKVKAAMVVNDAEIERMRESLQVLTDLQQVGSGAEASDRLARQIVDLSERLKVAEAEGARLREQLMQLENVSGVLDDVVVSAERMTASFSDSAKWTEDDADALEKLRDEYDKAAKEMKDVAKARALIDKAFATGNLGADAWEHLNNLIDESLEQFQKYKDALMDLKEVDFMTDNELKQNIAYIESLEDMEDRVNALRDQLDPTGAALREMADAQELLNKAFKEGVFDEQPELYEEMSQQIAKTTASLELMDDTFQRGGQEWLDTLAGMQNLFHQDSAAAEVLRTAMIALNIVLGVQAVLKQLSSGDPYSAIPRALAVAAMVASLGISTGAKGSAVAARSLQETQGTGTVLGDAEAKTESIVNATEITADATTELVGINRGMLEALQNLQGGVGGATTQITRGTKGLEDFTLPSFDLNKWVTGILLGGPIGMLVDNLLGGFFSGLLNKLFGGKSRVLDEGIRIVGGALSDLTEDVFVQAFQKYEAKKHIFDDWDTYWQFADLPDEVGRQFALVFGAIGDTVTEAALALGMSMEEINAALASFTIADIDISLQGLTGDEIEEELLAVFGVVFDNLAEAVIPWIGEFQKVGEGLGETLVRVATSVQVFQEAVKALGFTISDLDPQAFAQAAVELVELVGGVEEFISQFGSFFDKFAPEGEKLAFLGDQLTRAFEQAGLVLPETRDGMWELMQSLDASTESGREAIATLLRLAGVADEYYDLLEKGADDALDAVQTMTAEMARAYAEAFATFTGRAIYAPLRNLRDAFEDAMEAADALGASTREYALIARSFNAQLKQMAAELTLSIFSLADRLFGSTTQQSIATQTADVIGGGIGQGIEDGLQQTELVANDLFEEWERVLADLADFTKDILLDESLTTLTPAEQLAEAQRQFDDMLRRARGGDIEAAKGLPAAAKALLEEARFMFASSDAYTAIFDKVLAQLRSIQNPEEPFIEKPVEPDTTGGGTDTTDLMEVGGYMASALAQELERYLLAVELAQALKDLSQVLNTSVILLAEELKIPLAELAQILGLNLEQLTAATAEQLGEVAMLLGADVFELIEALGMNITDIATAFGLNLDEMTVELVAGLGLLSDALGVDVLVLTEALDLSIADLAETFGIGIEEFSAEQFRALIEFSETLGTGVTDIADALDLNLGEITDATSILSQALDTEISTLPPETASELQPYLDDIRNATTEADANQAIKVLGDYVLGLPPEISGPLLPYLEAMGYERIEPQLSAILDIAFNTGATVDAIHDLSGAMASIDHSVTVNVDVTVDEDLLKDKDPGYGYDPPKDPMYGLEARRAERAAAPIDAVPREKIFIPTLGWFAHGGEVEYSGIYGLHAGEYVMSRGPAAERERESSDTETARELAHIRSVLTDMREQGRRYYEADLQTSREMESSMKQQAEQQRRAVNG